MICTLYSPLQEETQMTQNQQAILNGLSELYPNAGPELQFTNP